MADMLKMELQTAVPAADLRFQAMTGREALSDAFEYTITAVSDKATLAADDLLGRPACVTLKLDDRRTRHFHGIVAGFGLEGVIGRLYTYRLELRPWLWLLRQRRNLRIFQEQSVPEILQQVFADYPATVRDQLSGSYAARPYCVQYRESDFDFVSRLMEEEGIFYFFRHGSSSHELVLADGNGVHTVPEGFDSVVFRDAAAGAPDQFAVTRWRVEHRVTSGKAALTDYNFETPQTDLAAEVDRHGGYQNASFEVYDYPGAYAAAADGITRAGLRVDALQLPQQQVHGSANTPGLVPGGLFTLKEHPRADQNIEHVVLASEVDMVLSGYEGGAGEDTRFECRFTAMPSSRVYRPATTTPRARVGGPQTAVVVGAGDAGDLHVDKYGRIKVQFHWDREGQRDAASSCWIRVASPLAGNGWGMLSLPRLGQEVVVDFLEGDPDQPLITGRVHNAEQMPPYTLPDHATVSTFKSRTRGGGADEFNELRFEDDPGNEYVLLQAQKDRLDIVKDTLRAQIGKDEHRTIAGDRKQQVDGAEHLTVGADLLQKIGAAFGLEVAQDMLLKVGGQHSLKAGGEITAKAGAAFSVDAAGDVHVKAGKNVGVDGGMNVHVKGGMNVVVEAGLVLTLKAGGSSVVLGPDGVSITGALVKINSGGSPGSGNGASPVAPTDPAAAEAPEPPEDPLTHA